MAPDFIAVCVPFIFGTFKKPAEHPIIAPPGKTGYGIDWNLTSIIGIWITHESNKECTYHWQLTVGSLTKNKL